MKNILIKWFNRSVMLCHDCKIQWTYGENCPECGKKGEYGGPNW